LTHLTEKRLPKTTPSKTEHPHIEIVPGVCGGRPVIAGTRMSVDFIARLHQLGEEAWEIMAAYPHLKPAAVYDAISYYLDHQEEMDRYLEESRWERLQERYGFEVREKGRIVFTDRAQRA
jgi:uncharacterized protein (DUF433 family)